MRSIAFIGMLGILLVACKPSKEVTTVVSSSDYPYIKTFHSGVQYKMKGQYENAILAFDSCLVVRPSDDAAAFGIAQCYLAQNEPSKAITYIQTATKIDPENIWYTQELGYLLYEQKKFEEALICFDKMVVKEPKNIDWLYGRADILTRLNRPADAIGALNKMEEQIGVIPDLSIQKFDLYRSLKQDEKGIAEIEKARKVYPSDLNLIGTMVDYYFQKNQINQAQSMLVELVKADPSNGRANLALGDLYLRQLNKPEAYRYYKAAFQANGVELDAKMNVLLNFYKQQTIIEKEVFELTELLKLKHPDEARVFSVIGDFHLQNNNKSEALIAYKQAIKLDGSKYPVWNQVLLLEYEQRQFEALYKDARACSALFPSLSNVQLLYTIACNQVERYQEAIDAADMGKDVVVNDKATEGEFYAQKAEALFYLGDTKGSFENYERALEIDPSNLLSKNNYCMRLALANVNLDKALTLINQVLTAAPDQPSFNDTKGMVLFQKGEYAEAKLLFTKANALQPNDPNFIDHLGDVTAKMGEANKAVEFWKNAKLLGSKNKSIDKKIQTKQYVAPVY